MKSQETKLVAFTCANDCGDFGVPAKDVTVVALDVDPPRFMVDALCATCDTTKSLEVDNAKAQSLLDQGAQKAEAFTSAEGARAGAFANPVMSPIEQAWFAHIMKTASPEQIASGKTPPMRLTAY